MTEPLIDGGEALRPEDAPAEPAAPEQIASEPASEPLAPSGEVDELDKLLAEWMRKILLPRQGSIRSRS
jgi:hypothetical protein